MINVGREAGRAKLLQGGPWPHDFFAPGSPGELRQVHPIDLIRWISVDGAIRFDGWMDG